MSRLKFWKNVGSANSKVYFGLVINFYENGVDMKQFSDIMRNPK